MPTAIQPPSTWYERILLNQNLAQLSQFIQGYSIETTPGAATKIPSYRSILPAGTTVYVTLLPGSSIDDTISVCIRLSAEGFKPVPHYAARQIPNRQKLAASLQRFRDEANGSQVLVLAGGASTPVGNFENSMQLLETGLFDEMGITQIGVAGHPEGSPDISKPMIEHALQWKNRFAQRTDATMYIVTQFCFEATAVVNWERQLKVLGNTLPVHIGVPGVATIGALLKHAKACGIGSSIKFLKKQARNTSKLLQHSTPERLLNELAEYCRLHPDSLIEQIHVYPLGGLRRSAEWLERTQSVTEAQNLNVA